MPAELEIAVAPNMFLQKEGGHMLLICAHLKAWRLRTPRLKMPKAHLSPDGSSGEPPMPQPPKRTRVVKKRPAGAGHLRRPSAATLAAPAEPGLQPPLVQSQQTCGMDAGQLGKSRDVADGYLGRSITNELVCRALDEICFPIQMRRGNCKHHEKQDRSDLHNRHVSTRLIPPG